MPDEADELDEIDTALLDCRQGDVLTAPPWSAHLAPADREVLAGTVIAPDLPNGLKLVSLEAEALVVITQSCDIVSPHAIQPYVQLAVLVRLDGDRRGLAAKGWMPGLVPLPSHGTDAFVDLHSLVQVHKSVVAMADRTRGCPTDASARAFRAGVARKFGRTAFPSDIVDCIQAMAQRIREKYGKSSTEGKFVDALEDVRVVVTPAMDAGEVDLFFWFVVPANEDDVHSNSAWDAQVEKWLERVEIGGRVIGKDGAAVRLDEMTAEQWLDSDSIVEAEVLSVL